MVVGQDQEEHQEGGAEVPAPAGEQASGQAGQVREQVGMAFFRWRQEDKMENLKSRKSDSILKFLGDMPLFCFITF